MPSRIAILFVGLFFPIIAQPASFDCTNVQSTVEKQICGSPELRLLDIHLYEVFQRLLRLPVNAKAVREAQRRWLTTQRDQCKTDACLADSYRERIDALGAEADALTVQPDACYTGYTVDQGFCSRWHMEEQERTMQDLIGLLASRYDAQTMGKFNRRQSEWKKNVACNCDIPIEEYMGPSSALEIVECESEFVSNRLQEIRGVLAGERDLAQEDTGPASCAAIQRAQAKKNGPGPMLPNTATSRGQYVLRATSGLRDFCPAFTANLNEFRDLAFDTCDPRLSPKYPQFSRPEWEEIPLDLALARKILIWNEESMRKAVVEESWQRWLKMTESDRAAGEVKLWRIKVDLLGDGNLDTLVRIDHAFDATRPSCSNFNSQQMITDIPDPQSAKLYAFSHFNNSIEVGGDMIYDAKSKRYYLLRWNRYGGAGGYGKALSNIGATASVLVNRANSQGVGPVCWIEWVPTNLKN